MLGGAKQLIYWEMMDNSSIERMKKICGFWNRYTVYDWYLKDQRIQVGHSNAGDRWLRKKGKASSSCHVGVAHIAQHEKDERISKIRFSSSAHLLLPPTLWSLTYYLVIHLLQVISHFAICFTLFCFSSKCFFFGILQVFILIESFQNFQITILNLFKKSSTILSKLKFAWCLNQLWLVYFCGFIWLKFAILKYFNPPANITILTN